MLAPMSRTLLATLALVTLWGTPAMTAAAQDDHPASSATREDARRRLHALFDEQWENWMRESPVWASVLGDHRYDDRWPDLRPEAHDELDRRDRAILDRLRAVDPALLSPQD